MDFKNGTITVNKENINVDSIPWVTHHIFEGVYMKDLITGEKTEGKISCHIVKIEKGFEIKNHIHQESHELHEVLYGDGYSIVNNIQIKYHSGAISLIEKGINHSVKAEKETIFMLAKFFPALK